MKKPPRMKKVSGAPAEPTPEPTSTRASPPDDRGDLLETLVTILWALVLAGIIRVFLFELFQIDGPSMEPTLYNNDRVFVSKMSYGVRLPYRNEAVINWALPNIGDVVILTAPGDNVDIVKRVVGLPGDVIELRDNRVFRNGVPLTKPKPPDPEETERDVTGRADGGVEEPLADASGDARRDPNAPWDPLLDELDASPCGEHAYRLHDEAFDGCLWRTEHLGEHTYRTSHADDFPYAGGRWTIPPGHIFVMGDHRDESRDSRMYGPVSALRLKGRAFFIYWSGSWPWTGTVRWNRLGHPLD